MPLACKLLKTGGETGIRTLDTVSRIHAFQACAFSHSAISPVGKECQRKAPAANFIVARCAPGLGSAGGARTRKLFLFLQLLGQVVLITHFVDGMQLGFERVDVVLFVCEDLLCEFT